MIFCLKVEGAAHIAGRVAREVAVWQDSKAVRRRSYQRLNWGAQVRKKIRKAAEPPQNLQLWQP